MFVVKGNENKFATAVARVGLTIIAATIVVITWMSLTLDAKADEFAPPETLSFVSLENDETVIKVKPTGDSVVENLKWLAIAIYFEGRNQSLDGQRRIAEVVLNRVRSPQHPNTIKKVVSEGSNVLNGCQFSFMCDGKAENVTDMRAWETAIKVAVETYRDWLNGQDFGCALYYRADYTTSQRALKWFASLRKLGQHGTHIFYCDPEA